MLADIRQPVVVVRAGVYTAEIVAQISAINPSTDFIL
jgi:hypothetical protein